MTSIRHAASAVLFLFTMMPALPLHGQPADRAGVATAVNTVARGLPPGGSERELDVGYAVVQRERIATDMAGQAQLLMLDGSSFTIGPDASVVLDEFYYDPAQGTGHAGFTLAKGLMRFVGGKLSKSQAVTIETPNGTIGIRGGIAVVEVDEAAANTRAVFLYGNEMMVRGKAGGVAIVTTPSSAVTIGRDGIPSKPERVGRALLARINKMLSGTVQRPVPSEIRLVKREAAPLPVKPPVPLLRPVLTRPPQLPMEPPHLPIQARPNPTPKRAETSLPPGACDSALQVCG